MSDDPRRGFSALIGAAADALKMRKEEVNRLNVFPVPDGDTGTNMSLTMDAVIAEVEALPAESSLAEVCRAVQHGSLMGARGNSGVILSQIVRGLCESLSSAEAIDPTVIKQALDRSVTVAFQAVRKPIEGTMLTVLRDAAEAAGPAVDEGLDITGTLERIVEEAYASVRRTPDLLPVLAEAGVVDAGGYGLAVLADGFTSVLEGREIRTIDVTVAGATLPDLMGVTPADDWDDQEHLYCTEFLLLGEGLDRDAIEEWMSQRGGSVLVVGDSSALKIHVHTDDPAEALSYSTGVGEVAEVHVNNMRRQTAARARGLAAEHAAKHPVKPVGYVAVAAGDGLVSILKSLGVDAVVSGGQTMNPSTADILEAIESVPAESVVVLPNNKNIIMTAQQAVAHADRPVAVVPTTSVPQAFSALLTANPEGDLDANVRSMTKAAASVRTGEVTTAVRDSRGKAGRIKKGQVIGIVEHEIEAVGSDVSEVGARVLDIIAGGGETLTLLAGADLSDEDLASISEKLAAEHPELEVESHRGDQPLYPLIMAVE